MYTLFSVLIKIVQVQIFSKGRETSNKLLSNIHDKSWMNEKFIKKSFYKPMISYS